MSGLVDAIIAALITGVLAGAGTIAVALIQKRNARAAGAAVQTAEQVEAARLINEAEAKADQVKADAAVEAAALVRRAQERAERTEVEREAWHERQVMALQQEIADLRGRLEGKP